MTFALALLLFSGTFSGTGKAVFKSGRSYECREIFLRMAESPALFKLNYGGYSCGDFLNTQFDPFKFEIKNGSLVHQGKVYGSITDQTLSYTIFDPDDGSTYNLTLTKTSDGIRYYEEWHDEDTIALTVSGNLVKK